MKKKILVFAGVLAALVGGLAAFLLSIDVNQFRPQIEAQMQKSLKRTVTLGTLSLKLVPLAVGVDNVTIGEAPAVHSTRPFVTAKQIEVRAALLPLLQKRLDVDALVLRQPAVELVRTERGTWNFSDIGGGGGGPEPAGGGGSLGLGRLEIVDGSVGVTDLQAHTPRAVYDHIDLTLSGYAPGRKFNLELDVRLPGSGKLAVNGTGGPLPSTAFTGKASLKDVSLASLRGFLSMEKTDADATISGDATLTASGTATHIDGKLTAKDVRYGDIKLPQPVEVAYRVVNDSERKTTQIPTLKITSGDAAIDAALSLAAAGVSGNGTIQSLTLPLASLKEPVVLHSASFRLDPGSAKFDNVKVSLANSNLSGSVGVRNFAAPDIQFTAAIDQVDAGELQKLSAGGGAAPAKSAASSGPPKITGGGSVQIGTIKYNNLLLKNVQATCTLDHGLIRLSPLSAQSSGGQVSGDIQYDGRQEPAAIAVNTKLDKVDANQLLSSATSLKDVIAGLLSGDTQAQFLSRPGEDITKSLNGAVRFQLTDGKLQRVNVLNEVASIGRFLGATRRSEPYTAILKLAGSMVFRNGVGTTDDLKLDLDGGSVAAAGTVNLVDQTLNMKVTAVLNKELSQKAGGNQIGGFMSTVLANPQGELVIPALVTGTMSQPRFLPDAERFAQMKLKGLLPSAANPAGGAAQAVKGIMDSLRGQKPAVDQPATGQQQQPVDSLLNLFRKKKNDKPPQK